ncbi:fungal-specific transcription factor domain-containing protein [Triangularia verruculosa]|uniref:Fungal-specific transcription factor domain-containing protein n=1 Tax=Triangularia verruculosa TaxID=2587418 RepID=A0AAN6XBH8_9PEZI|nr:fungal-specific transcription factor domain-containing protein [Triangularia verruculosa]
MPAPASSHAHAHAHAPPSPDLHPAKRMRQSSPGPDGKDSPASLSLSAGANSPLATPTHEQHPPQQDGGRVGQSSNFRNVSACNRCRLRKNRCDQRLPSCASCEKAGVACVGYDPITKREIPRSYIFYLEKRVEQLEGILGEKKIGFPRAEELEWCSKVNGLSRGGEAEQAEGGGGHQIGGTRDGDGGEESAVVRRETARRIGQAQGRQLGSTTGISFARVVFAAVQSSVSDQRSNSDKGGIRPYKPPAGGNGTAGQTTSMRDSFFGLHTRPTIHPATFPSKELGLKLINLYFEHANPQMPVVHRVDFMQMFEQAYAEEGRVRGPRELYCLNMVFAIGAGIILAESKGDRGTKQCQPEEYHASAIVHLEACLGSGGGLEELQAVLLLANFALLRPVPPGLWYIIGVAVRLAVDLGLHYEDGKDVDAGLNGGNEQQKESLASERGRREYTRDMRRRLWWCTYSFDRLVSVCVGRPFGISDQVITTEFPSLLDDKYITPTGFLEAPQGAPTYKLVAHHYFRLRLLQSEISQVLQYQQAKIARDFGQNQKNPHMHTSLPSPFLSRFDSFRSWRINIDKRLYEWKMTAPMKQDTGVAFLTEFLDLNYWQAIIMLYRQSLSVPEMFEGEYHTAKEVDSPSVYSVELREDEDRVYLKVAEAGQKILRLYRQLHLAGLVNHTYLTTHHLFVAGISYLYAIWHSPIVRSRLSMDEVDFTILAATSVFTDLMDKCPPAEACRDAFDRTVKATLKMVNARGGFGQKHPPPPSSTTATSRNNDHHRMDWSSRSDTASLSSHSHSHQHKQRPPPPPPPHRTPSSIDQISDLASDAYSTTTPSQFSAFKNQYRPQLKTEPDGFSLMRNLPGPPRSNASSVNEGPLTPEAGMPSPAGNLASPGGVGGLGSPMVNMPPPSGGGMFSPGLLSYNDLQGIEFLRGLNTTEGGLDGGGGQEGGNSGGMMDANMDLGFGLGWNGGMGAHDFSDGAGGVDLFDGFFFGGQQGSGGVGGGGGCENVMDR